MSTNRAVVLFSGPEAGIVARALSPEAGRDVPRASVRIDGLAGEVTLTIDADDVAAMRAALNSYLRWADVAVKMAREVRE